VAALGMGLWASPASAAAQEVRRSHTFTTTAGQQRTCDVFLYESWLDGEATVFTELGSPAPCAAAAISVRWHFVDASGAAHDGKEVVTGGSIASADLHGVAGDLSSRHRVTFADCSANCTFGPVGFSPFRSSK
jgi:hypothetical protein